MPRSSSLPPQQPVILSDAKGRVEGPAVAGCPTLNSFTVKDGSLRSLRLPTLSRLLQSATLACVLLLTLGATDPAARFNKLGHAMICGCSCGQILLECNHVNCPMSGPMIGELHDQLATGGTDTSIFHWFAAKYGATILASPIRGGFDNVAWIMPISVFFLATIGTAIIIRVWKLRSTNAPVLVAAPRNAAANALRERIRRETEY